MHLANDIEIVKGDLVKRQGESIAQVNKEVEAEKS
jgi:hypothetical protein